MAMALACHGGPSIPPLRPPHEHAVQRMWDAFDLVGATELFDEFLVLLTDLVGLQVPAYRSQLSTAQTEAAREAQRSWTQRSCASLVADPPAALLAYIRHRTIGARGSRFRRHEADSMGALA